MDVSLCSGTPASRLAFSGGSAGTVYNWTNTNTAIGLAAEGSGAIPSFLPVNNTSTVQSATITVTPQGGTGFAYLAGGAQARLYVMSLSTYSITDSISVGAGPGGVVVVPHKSRIYVTSKDDNQVAAINSLTNTVLATIPVGARPTCIAAAPDGNRIYVGNTDDGTISVINTNSNTVIATIPVGAAITGIAVSPDASHAYVTLRDAGLLAEINLITNSQVRTIPVGQNPQAVLIAPDASRLYVTNLGSNNLSVVNPLSGTVVATIPTGQHPYGLATRSDGTLLYVSNRQSGTISVINTATNTILTTVTLGPGTEPEGVAVSNDGSSVFVNERMSGKVFIINTATNTLATTLPFWFQPASTGNFLGPGFCYGSPQSFTITVRPAPAASLRYPGSPYCATGTALPEFSGDTGGDFSAEPGLLINSTSGEVNLNNSVPGVYSVTYTLPVVNGCNSSTATTRLIVNATTEMDQPASQNICAGNITAAVAFTGAAGSNYSWTNTNPSVGLTAAGIGNIPAFSALNSGSIPQTAGITVTPRVPAARFAYIPNRSSNTISVIHTATNTVVTNITSGNEPSSVNALPDGSRIFVSNRQSGTVTVVNTYTNTVVANIGVGISPAGIAVAMDGSKVYVLNVTDKSVSVINPAQNVVTATFLLPGSAVPDYAILTNSDNTRLYVPLQNGSVLVMDATNGNVITSVPTHSATALALSPDGIRLYAGNKNQSNIEIINTASNTIIGAVTLSAGASVAGLAISPDGSRIYTSNRITNNVSVIDASTHTVSSNIPVGSGLGIHVSPDGALVYVSVPADNAIKVIDAASDSVTHTIPSGGLLPDGRGYAFAQYYRNGCPGPQKFFTITVGPAPVASLSYTGTPFCATGTALPTVNGASGGVYSAASGLSIDPATGEINLAASTPGTYTITYTLAAANGCQAVVATTDVVIRPVAIVNIPANQSLCAGSATAAVIFSGNASNTVYSWTNSNPAIGLSTAGIGDIAAFTAQNSGNDSISARITVIPRGSSGYCDGPEQSFTISIRPRPFANFVNDRNVCAGSITLPVSFTSPVARTTFQWTNSNPSVGLAASGTGDLPSFVAVNGGSTVQYARIRMVPVSENCSGDTLSFLIAVQARPQVAPVNNLVICNGASTPTIQFSGNLPDITYSWNNNNPAIGLADSARGAIAPFTALNAGMSAAIAQITVTPSNTLCTGIPTTFTITVNPTPTMDGVLNQAVCNGATASAVSFTSPFNGVNYQWTNDVPSIGLQASGTGSLLPFTAVNPGNTPRIATITVTPVSQNCPGVPATFTLTVNPTPTVSPVASLTLCANTSSGLTGFTGAVAGTVFQWTNSNPGIGVAGSGSGTLLPFVAINATNAPQQALFTVSPSANGCTGASTSFMITVHPLPTVDTVFNQVLCNGAASMPLAWTSPVAGTSFSWINSNASIGLPGSGNGNLPGFTAVNTGVSVQQSIISVRPFANNCVGPVRNLTITVNPTPTAAAISSQSLCNGVASIPVTFSGTIANSSFAWTNSNAAIGLGVSGAGDIPAFIVTNATNAPISGTITVTPTASNCTGPAQTFTVTANPTPTVNAVSNQSICNGATSTAVSFTGPVWGSSFVWTNNNTNTGLAASGNGDIAPFTGVNFGNAPISSTITVIPSANNCSGPASTLVLTINPTPVLDPIANQELCNGASTTAVNFISSVAGSMFNWTNTNTAIGLAASGSNTIPSFLGTNSTSAPISGLISVTPIANNCQGAAASFDITVNPTPTVNAVIDQTLCTDAQTSNVIFSGAVNGTNYSWTNSNADIGLGTTGNGNIASFTTTNSTIAPITGTIAVTPHARGCVGLPSTFTITVNPVPTVDQLSNQTICSGASLPSLALAGPVAGTTYEWSNSLPFIGLNASGSGNLPGFTASNSTGVPLTAVITAIPTANGCTGTPRIFTITVNPLPVGSITTPRTFICDGFNTPLQISGGSTYQWLLNGNIITGASGATYNAVQAGTYSVNITSAEGCTQAAANTQTLRLVRRPTAGFTFDKYCQNESVRFTNTTDTVGSGIVFYRWFYVHGQDSVSQHLTTQFADTGTLQVWLVASPNGCTALNDTARRLITIVAPVPGRRLPAVNVRVNERTGIEGRAIQDADYHWSPGTGLSSTSIRNPEVMLTTEQDYKITAEQPSGCITVDSLLVRVFTANDIFVPTAFSPNGDGINDVLRPITVGINSFRQFRVFDRNGREIFRSTSVNEAWDGTYRGLQLPMENYVWVVEGTDNTGKVIRKSGQVALLR